MSNETTTPETSPAQNGEFKPQQLSGVLATSRYYHAPRNAQENLFQARLLGSLIAKLSSALRRAGEDPAQNGGNTTLDTDLALLAIFVSNFVRYSTIPSTDVAWLNAERFVRNSVKRTSYRFIPTDNSDDEDGPADTWSPEVLFENNSESAATEGQRLAGTWSRISKFFDSTFGTSEDLKPIVV